ncbi:MAG: TetR/AcrR family transcriptional regulator [Paracoccus sp. (in: a-proteobacteria)]|nr:TetR/AcrR family transcriptional regulator [Paracoccus sp. (in: a-proteobacteria)]
MAGRKTYHHGNLREALIEAAADLIEEAGPQGFTLAEAARRAGVSPAAPYRHFQGREDLIEALALRGFEIFAARLAEAHNKGRPNPLAAFTRLGGCYLDFAQDFPGYYMAMFESGVAISGNSDLARAADRALSVLVDAASALFASLPAEKRPPARMVANHIWAMSHGVVELFSRGKPGSRTPYAPADMLESGVIIYLRGLGVMDA